MEIKTVEVTGIESAIMRMRNPYSSWVKSDSGHVMNELIIGKKDMDLSVRLQKAGPEHCKHLRFVHVVADITAPLFYWKQFDTYRIGVEKISTSTMHTLTANPLTLDDFEHNEHAEVALSYVIGILNGWMEEYHDLIAQKKQDEAKEVWTAIIQLLPESYLQMRSVQISYATLRNIIHQRKGHKLGEWKTFIDWCHTLPEEWMLFDE